MELSSRKCAVLKAIIRTYLETGEPVGSKVLTEMLENAPSSATLRNEMSALCSLGLLQQPHTSAGRMPTNRGLQLYVKSLMKPVALNRNTMQYIDKRLETAAHTPEMLPAAAGQILSEFTGFPAISCYVVGDTVRVQRAQAVPFGAHTAMLVLITTDGRARSRLCRLPRDFRSAEFRTIVERCICDKPLNSLDKACLQNVIASAGLNALSLMPLITALFELAQDAAVSPVMLSGESGLSKICGEENTRRLLTLAEHGDPILSIFSAADDETAVFFGREFGFRDPVAATVVVTKYYQADRYCGRIGIVGPSRMAYEQIMPSIEYTASSLTKLMTEAGKDMED